MDCRKRFNRIYIMKKIFIILSILLVGCTSVEDHSKPRAVKSVTLVTEPMLFKFNGHEYIRFYFSTYQSGVVHNPDCPCYELNSKTKCAN